MRRGLDVASAVTNHDADVPVTADLVAWADIIFVMERVHATKLRQRFGKHLKLTRLVLSLIHISQGIVR